MSLISGVQGRCVRSSSNALFGWSLSLTRPSTYVPEIDLEDIISIEKTLESATSWHLIRKDKLKAWNHTRITPALLVCIAASSKVSTYLFFATSPLKGLSEQDYAKKVLSPLLEIAFHGSSLITHWGDTISEDNQKVNMPLRMDLRMIIQQQPEQWRQGFVYIMIHVRPFAKNVQQWKYYKDKAKSVRNAKWQLNSPVNRYPDLNSGFVQDIMVPFTTNSYTFYCRRLTESLSVEFALKSSVVKGTWIIMYCIDSWCK